MDHIHSTHTLHRTVIPFGIVLKMVYLASAQRRDAGTAYGYAIPGGSQTPTEFTVYCRPPYMPIKGAVAL